MKTYKTEAKAFRRQAFLASEYGVFSGAQRVGNRWRLLFDPDTIRDRVDVQLPDTEAEYQEDIDRFDWLPTDDE